jgi:Spy/CpxP family protein refolding chaperone
MKPGKLINGTTALILGSALAAATAVVGSRPVAADPHGMGMQAHYAEHRGQVGHQGYGKHPCHGAGHGEGMSRLFGPDWRTTLSPEQQAALDRLHVAYAKAKMPLKAQAEVLKVELAALALEDQPDTEAIKAKIDELLALKRTMTINKYEYVAAKRKVLTSEQRVSFDMDAIKRSKHGRKGKRHH